MPPAEPAPGTASGQVWRESIATRSGRTSGPRDGEPVDQAVPRAEVILLPFRPSQEVEDAHAPLAGGLDAPREEDDAGREPSGGGVVARVVEVPASPVVEQAQRGHRPAVAVREPREHDAILRRQPADD